MGWDRALTRISSLPTFIKRLAEFAHLEHNSTKNSVKRSGWGYWIGLSIGRRQDLNLRPPRPERGALPGGSSVFRAFGAREARSTEMQRERPHAPCGSRLKCLLFAC